jgi:hypothetical protein
MYLPRAGIFPGSRFKLAPYKVKRVGRERHTSARAEIAEVATRGVRFFLALAPGRLLASAGSAAAAVALRVRPLVDDLGSAAVVPGRATCASQPAATRSASSMRMLTTVTTRHPGRRVR